MQEMNDSDEHDKSTIFLEDIDIEKIFSDALSQHDSSAYVQEALDILKSDLCLDWYQKESVISTMRLHLTKLLSTKPEFDRSSATEKAKEIINTVYKRLSNRSHEYGGILY